MLKKYVGKNKGTRLMLEKIREVSGKTLVSLNRFKDK